MENILADVEKAVEAEVQAALPAVEAKVEAVAALDIQAICNEAIKHLTWLLNDKVAAHPDGKGLRSTLNFAIGRFVAEKDQA